MAKITTKELMNRFFAAELTPSNNLMRTNVDRKEMYAYLNKLSDQMGERVELVDLDVDQIYEMLLTYRISDRPDDNRTLSLSTYSNLLSLYRSIFQWYSDNIELIRNPFLRKEMRLSEAKKRLSQHEETFTTETLQNIINLVREDYKNQKERAEYIECILLLFYNGCQENEDIVDIREEDIDHENKTLVIRGIKRRLSDRCYELLVKVHNMTVIEGETRKATFRDWNGSYFKFPSAFSKQEFDEKPKIAPTTTINNYLSQKVAKKHNIKVSGFTIFYLGFYDNMVKKIGKERVNYIIQSKMDGEATNQLVQLAREYGINVQNPSQIRTHLHIFVEV